MYNITPSETGRVSGSQIVEEMGSHQNKPRRKCTEEGDPVQNEATRRDPLSRKCGLRIRIIVNLHVWKNLHPCLVFAGKNPCQIGQTLQTRDSSRFDSTRRDGWPKRIPYTLTHQMLRKGLRRPTKISGPW